MNFLKKVIYTIDKYNMINKGDKVIVAVSGGPDSICLLDVLKEIKDQYNVELYAAHLNHCLRGKDADQDEEYVKKFCIKNNIVFFSKRVDVNKLANKNNISCEMAGRKARYDYFMELKNRINAQKIALAHNSNDNAETIIMRIIRGTGLDGLEGIKPVRDGIFIRPLINISRKEIEKYCKDRNINPRIDKTNLEKCYTRNKIRLDLIPYVEKNFNKDFVNTINRFSEIITKDNEYIKEVSFEKYKKHCIIHKNKIIINKNLFNEHEAIVTRVIRKCIIKMKGNLQNINKKDIYDIISLQKKGTGKKIILSDDILICNSYNDIYIYDKKFLNTHNNIQINIDINSEKVIKSQGIKIKTEVIEDDIQNIDLCKNDYIKYFDMDKINGNIIFRYRKTGDKFNPLGMTKYKKLKDLFIDLKIPKEERNSIPLICFGEEIAWVVGYKLSNKFKIDKNTKKILKIQIEREEMYE